MSTLSLHSRIRQERFRRHVLAGIGGALARAVFQRVAAWRRSREELNAARRLAGETRLARALAERYDQTDRGFSADLRAAVARHERAAAGLS